MAKVGRPKGSLDKHPVEYALYKGDKFIDIGSRAKLAEMIGVSPDTITYYASPSYKKRFVDLSQRVVVVKLD